MGGFSGNGGGNPLLKVGAAMIDAYTGVPVASTALTVAEANAARQGQASAAQQGYDRQTELLRRQEARAVQDKQDLLRRATATQRARLGAMGVGSGGGSSEAVINGLQQQAATEISDITAAYDDRLSVLDWGLSKQKEELDAAGRNQMLQQAVPLFDIFKPGKDEQNKRRRQPAPDDGGDRYSVQPGAGFNLL